MRNIRLWGRRRRYFWLPFWKVQKIIFEVREEEYVSEVLSILTYNMQQKRLISVFWNVTKKYKYKVTGRTFALPLIFDSFSLSFVRSLRSSTYYSVLASVSTGVCCLLLLVAKVVFRGCAGLQVVVVVSSTVRSDVADGRRFGVLFRQRDRLPVPPVVD